MISTIAQCHDNYYMSTCFELSVGTDSMRWSQIELSEHKCNSRMTFPTAWDLQQQQRQSPSANSNNPVISGLPADTQVLFCITPASSATHIKSKTDTTMLTLHAVRLPVKEAKHQLSHYGRGTKNGIKLHLTRGKIISWFQNNIENLNLNSPECFALCFASTLIAFLQSLL